MKKKVSVIGGAGHAGLGMCLVLANRGYFVYGIDINESANVSIMGGTIPFIEKGGEEYLGSALNNRTIVMTADFSKINESDVIIIVLGTPIDESFNPDLAPLSKLVKENSKYFKKGQLIILRSTVSPCTTNAIKNILEAYTGLKVGEDVFLVFAPERVLQGKAIREIQILPQLIGAFDDESYRVAEEFFLSFVRNKCFKLNPVEAEIGKLISNMTRYVMFSLVNEYYLIADSFGANIHRIIDACNYDYPRLNLPGPGPNVGGPCLYKDGWFLLERFPFTELLSDAFKINEGMTMQIVRKIEQYDHIKKISILGLTFKANNDDTRNSLSFKLKKQLERNTYDLILIDPYVKGNDDIRQLEGSEAVILMTPHMEFKDLKEIMALVSNEDCLYVDIWGFWDIMRYKSRNGYFFGKEAKIEYLNNGN